MFGVMHVYYKEKQSQSPTPSEYPSSECEPNTVVMRLIQYYQRRIVDKNLPKRFAIALNITNLDELSVN